MKLTSRWLGLLLLALIGCAYAQQSESDPERQRAVRLAEQLRCLVCQNQSIADSAAPLAVDLRREIKEQIGKGRSDPEIVKFMVERYGDFVLYNPPLKATTLLLWFGPLALLLVGAIVLIRNLRQRRQVSVAPLSDEEARAAAELLRPQGEGERR